MSMPLEILSPSYFETKTHLPKQATLAKFHFQISNFFEIHLTKYIMRPVVCVQQSFRLVITRQQSDAVPPVAVITCFAFVCKALFLIHCGKSVEVEARMKGGEEQGTGKMENPTDIARA